MPEINDVIDEVKKLVVPTQKERKELENMYNQIEKNLKSEQSPYFRYMFCGSVAKDTWLSGHKDIDLFLLFQPNIERAVFKEIGLSAAKNLVKKLNGTYSISYAEHPYVKANINQHKIDIVPAYDVSPGKIKSSVDRTPHHVVYIEKKLHGDMRDDVRVLKQFCKAANIYGSDLKTMGFSGYLCELLIIRYRSFQHLMEMAQYWSPGQIIDVENHFKNKNYLRNKKFKNDPLIVIDPVDKNRNVASVLSTENFMLFVERAREFMKNPAMKYFSEGRIPPMEIEEIKNRIKERGTNFIIISFPAPQVIPDILWPQLKKFAKRLVNLLTHKEFKVLRTGTWSNDLHSIIIMEMEIDSLPSIEKRKGPGIFDRENSEKFLKRYENCNVFIEKNCWVVEYNRRFKKSTDLLKDFLSKKKEDLLAGGVPKNIAEEISEDVELASHNDIYKIFRRYIDLRRYMQKYFHKLD